MSRTTHRRLTGVAIAAALTLAACGGDDTADQADAAAPITVEQPDGSAATTAAPESDTSAGSGDVVPGDPATGKPEVHLPAETPTELVVTDLVEGTGDTVEAGDSITVDYVGVLSADGTEFDNSYDRGQPLTVTIGVGQIIPGWDEGLVGAKEGGRRQLDIPADLAYGDAGAGGVIPPGAALTFVVDILEPTPPPTLAPTIDTANCPAPDGSSEQRQEFDEYPPTCIDPSATYTAEIVTNKGTVVVELDAEAAPLTVNNFVTLARYHFFDGVSCHRIIPGFMAQCGDPTGTGSGGPGYAFPDELPDDSSVYVQGTVAMANAGPNTNGSQFFIITGDATFLPPSYSVFGTVIEGVDDTLAALDAAGNPDDNGVPPLEPVDIESVTITES